MAKYREDLRLGPAAAKRQSRTVGLPSFATRQVHFAT